MYFFSLASAKAERHLSSLYGMFLYVEWGDPMVYTPNAPIQTIGPSQLTNQSNYSISWHNKKHMASHNKTTCYESMLFLTLILYKTFQNENIIPRNMCYDEMNVSI